MAGWVAAWAAVQLLGRTRRRDLRALWRLEHALLALALGSGVLLMLARGWGLGQARWLGVKLGLVAFLLLPLEGMHAFACHVWIARGLREAQPSRQLERGRAMEEMVRTLGLVLLGAGLPLLLWLSLKKPF